MTGLRWKNWGEAFNAKLGEGVDHGFASWEATEYCNTHGLGLENGEDAGHERKRHIARISELEAEQDVVEKRGIAQGYAMGRTDALVEAEALARSKISGAWGCWDGAAHEIANGINSLAESEFAEAESE